MNSFFKIILISILVCFNALKAQSFITLKDGKRINCLRVMVKKNYLVLNDKNNKKLLKIEKDSVLNYYQYNENAFFKNIDGFKEEIVKGELTIYRGELVIVNFGSVISQYSEYFKWYIAKDSLPFYAFNETNGGISFINTNVFKKSNFKKNIWNVLQDDSISMKQFNTLGIFSKLEELLVIINSYNARAALKKNRFKKDTLNTKSSKVILFRNYRKEGKEDLEFTINDKNYILERNSKITIEIPYNTETVICLSNSNKNTCAAIISSLDYPKYYQLKLDKKKNGLIERVNGHSSYYTARLKYFDEKAKK